MGRVAPTFGLFLPQMRMGYQTILERVLTAENAGFDAVWFMDHLAPPMLPDADCFEAWTLATAVATRTSRIRVGHMVLCDGLRHPSLLAKMAATLDVVSDGRLDLGIGWGSVASELEQFGFGADPAAVRSDRLAETLTLLRLLWSGEPVDFEGRHFTLRGAQQRPVPVQAPLPVHVGGAGDRTIGLARDHGDWWNCPATDVARFPELSRLVGDDVCKSVQRVVGLAATSASRDSVAETARRRFGSWGGLVTGTPDEVTEVLRADVAAGADGFVIGFSDFADVATLALFARAVIPAVSES